MARVYTAEDGRIVAHLLMDAVGHAPRKVVSRSKEAKERRRAAVADFVMRTAMLSDAAFGHFQEMLTAIVGNTYHGVRVVPAQDPALLTQAEATAIGKSCKAIRLRRPSNKSAVHELLHNYGALLTFSQSNAWFGPLLETIFLRQAQASRLQMVVVLFLRAALSLFDVVSDLVTIGFNFILGQSGVALAITGLVLLSQALQIAIVVMKNAHCGWRAVLKEVGIVLSFFKPTVDVARMMRGYEVAGAPFSTHIERMACKVVESCVESIPTMLIQLYQFFLTGVWSNVAVVSIVISYIVTASKASMIAFDLDRNLQQRAFSPKFYGYVPDAPRRRWVAQAFLFLFGLAHIINKSLSVALLFATEPAWGAALICGDVGLMFLYKLARNDLHVWVPGSGVWFAFWYRLVGKLMCDFTALVHCRHPLELGGLWWVVSMLLSHAESFLAGWLHSQYYQGPTKFESGVTFAVSGSLAALWAVAFIGFLLSIERTHIRTFFSLETGPKFVQFRFMDSGATDEQRCAVLLCNPRMWRPIQDSITEWIERSWAKWKQDPPEWFTADWIASIPDDMIPKSFANILSSQPPLGPAGKLKRESSIKAKKSGSIILLSSTLPGLEIPSSSDPRPVPGTVV